MSYAGNTNELCGYLNQVISISQMSYADKANELCAYLFYNVQIKVVWM